MSNIEILRYPPNIGEFVIWSFIFFFSFIFIIFLITIFYDLFNEKFYDVRYPRIGDPTLNRFEKFLNEHFKAERFMYYFLRPDTNVLFFFFYILFYILLLAEVVQKYIHFGFYTLIYYSSPETFIFFQFINSLFIIIITSTILLIHYFEKNFDIINDGNFFLKLFLCFWCMFLLFFVIFIFVVFVYKINFPFYTIWKLYESLVDYVENPPTLRYWRGKWYEWKVFYHFDWVVETMEYLNNIHIFWYLEESFYLLILQIFIFIITDFLVVLTNLNKKDKLTLLNILKKLLYIILFIFLIKKLFIYYFIIYI